MFTSQFTHIHSQEKLKKKIPGVPKGLRYFNFEYLERFQKTFNLVSEWKQCKQLPNKLHFYLDFYLIVTKSVPTCATVPETITVGQPTHHLISKSWAENFGSAPHKFPQECRNFDTFQLYMHTTVSVLDPHQKRWETDRIILFFPEKRSHFFSFLYGKQKTSLFFKTAAWCFDFRIELLNGAVNEPLYF